ncbi:GOLPH3/VPS74 family protein [Microlunatus speluncae]|uniref:GOLPH3/VPS74 family protein n=1 Tax=Microlunatus speluncae TaxID=2594267 RepID=UPI001375A42E|nr:GPP34 family phosphoprotein [Microlunatus speluncae]
MLIAEKFLLLVIDDRTGKRIIGRDRLDPALGGAVLAELALRQRIGITGDDAGLLRRRRVSVTDPTPTGDEVLDHLLVRIGEKPDQKAANLITATNFKRGKTHLLEQLTERLVAAGVLSEQQGRILGLFPTSSWPTADAAPEHAVRQWLEAALIAGATPDEPTRVLIALLSATDSLAKVVPSDDRRAVRARAKELNQGDWTAATVKQVIDEVSAAVTAAMVASSSGSG